MENLLPGVVSVKVFREFSTSDQFIRSDASRIFYVLDGSANAVEFVAPKFFMKRKASLRNPHHGGLFCSKVK